MKIMTIKLCRCKKFIDYEDGTVFCLKHGIYKKLYLTEWKKFEY